MQSRAVAVDPTPRCGNCFFEIDGQCHYGAPVPAGFQSTAAWPRIKRTDWCSKWSSGSGGGEVGPAGPEGPPGPTAVSTDAGNVAKLGTDQLLLVPQTSVFMGVVDGSEGAPGTIGEYKVTSNVVGVQMAADTPTQICSIHLTPGDWEIWGSVDFLPPSNVSPNMIAASVSVHPNELPNQDDLMTGVGILNMFTTTALTSGQRQVLMTGQCRSNSAAPLDLYLVAQTAFASGASTVLSKGYICARRVR
jgi:hypothetical protein